MGEAPVCVNLLRVNVSALSRAHTVFTPTQGLLLDFTTLPPSTTPLGERSSHLEVSHRLADLPSLVACRLIDGTNITTEDEHMWLIPFSPGLDHVLMIHFDRAQSIAGLRLWNYNKSPEDTYRGVSRAERSPLSGRQHDEWLVWVLERSINPPEPSE